MVALWQLLDNIQSNPKAKKKSSLGGGMQLSYIWPLPPTKEEWFDSRPNSFNDLSNEEIIEFFSSNIADRINWYEMNMYACDWIYKRPKQRITQDLQSKRNL